MSIEETNGLIYGLVQSGKTGVLTVTGAMGAQDAQKMTDAIRQGCQRVDTREW